MLKNAIGVLLICGTFAPATHYATKSLADSIGKAAVKKAAAKVAKQKKAKPRRRVTANPTQADLMRAGMTAYEAAQYRQARAIRQRQERSAKLEAALKEAQEKAKRDEAEKAKGGGGVQPDNTAPVCTPGGNVAGCYVNEDHPNDIVGQIDLTCTPYFESDTPCVFAVKLAVAQWNYGLGQWVNQPQLAQCESIELACPDQWQYLDVADTTAWQDGGYLLTFSIYKGSCTALGGRIDTESYDYTIGN